MYIVDPWARLDLYGKSTDNEDGGAAAELADDSTRRMRL